MRRIAVAVVLTAALVGAPAQMALAAPSPAPSGGAPATANGTKVCTVDGTKNRLSELTGLAASSQGWAVISGRDTKNLALMKIYLLDTKCNWTLKSLTYATQANDPQDIQLSADGKSYWVADTGDENVPPTRSTIGVWKVPLDGSASSLYRFTYPGGATDAHNVKAMVMGGNGLPIFITADSSGTATVYAPAGTTLGTANSKPGQPLKKAGTFTAQATGTPNTLNQIGNLTVTGAAVSPDGKHVVVRTYSDAYEWDVSNGDVLGAITGSTAPIITPLVGESGNGEPLGQAITFSPDGAAFQTLSFVTGSTTTDIVSYPPNTATVKPTVPAGHAPAAPPASGGLLSKLSLNQLTYLIAGVGVLGLILVIAGIAGIARARRRRREMEDEYDEYGYDDAPRSGGSAVYGAPRSPSGGFRGYGEQYGEAYGPDYGGEPYGDPYGQPEGGYAGRGYGQDYGEYGGSDPGGRPARYRPDGYPEEYGDPGYDSEGYGGSWQSGGGGYDAYAGSDFSHGGGRPRTEPRRGNGRKNGNGSYADEHQGFGDLRDLS